MFSVRTLGPRVMQEAGSKFTQPSALGNLKLPGAFLLWREHRELPNVAALTSQKMCQLSQDLLCTGGRTGCTMHIDVRRMANLSDMNVQAI